MARRFLLILLLVAVPQALMAATLRVGMSADYPPLTYKQEGKMVGLEADNARAVAELLDMKLELVELPFADLIPALEEGRIDVIMSGFSITEDRAQRVAFVDPYLDIGQMLITLTEKAGAFVQPWTIYREGLRIGVEPGTTGAEFAARELTEAVIVEYPEPTAAFEGLRRNEIVAYIHDAPTSWRLATTSDNNDLISLYQPLTKEQLAWAVAKTNTGLRVRLNRALSELRANGTLAYIFNRWIPVTVEVRDAASATP